MQTLSITEKDQRQGFLSRQFSAVATVRQREFDAVFGVGLPIICIAADPIVFRSSFGFQGYILDDYQIGAYALSSVAILAMAAWQLWGERLGEYRPYLAGLFFVSAIVSFLVGLILIPFSLLGLLFFLFGALGFTPLFSAFVFMRNAVRAFREASTELRTDYVWHAALVTALYAVVIPIVLSFQ